MLRWHRELFRLFWKRKSKADSRQPKLSPQTIALIKEMARNNRRLLSGAHPRRVAQAGYSRVQTHDPEVHAARSPASRHLGRSGRPFSIITLLICGPAMRLQVTDLCFRPLVAFFLIELKSRKVTHVGVTRSPCAGYLAYPFQRKNTHDGSTSAFSSQSTH